MKLPLLAQDKANHFVYGAVLFTVGYLAGLQIGEHPLLSGMVLTAVVAIGREAYSRVTGKGTYDPLDAVATMAGAVPSAIVAMAHKVF